MPTVTLEEAQAGLRDLIHNLPQGEELVITENDYPIARLTRSPRTLCRANQVAPKTGATGWQKILMRP